MLLIDVNKPFANAAAGTAMMGDRSMEMLTIKVPFQTRSKLINGPTCSILASSLHIKVRLEKSLVRFQY